MNPRFVYKKIKVGDTVRITTDIAVGVIGIVTDIDMAEDGIEVKGFKDTKFLEQINNAIEFETAIFPITEIKYMFKLKLNEIKPNEQ